MKMFYSESFEIGVGIKPKIPTLQSTKLSQSPLGKQIH